MTKQPVSRAGRAALVQFTTPEAFHSEAEPSLHAKPAKSWLSSQPSSWAGDDEGNLSGMHGRVRQLPWGAPLVVLDAGQSDTHASATRKSDRRWAQD